jgi:N,N'-diacetyllegionaminate synthase
MALGARIYERHIKESAGGDAIDEAVSSNASQLAAVIASAEQARRAFGHGRREPQPAERGNLDASRRALYATRDLTPGDIVQPSDVIALRPAAGVSPAQQARLIGSCLSRPIAAGEAFKQTDLQADRRGSSRPWSKSKESAAGGVEPEAGEGTRGAA